MILTNISPFEIIFHFLVQRDTPQIRPGHQPPLGLKPCLCVLSRHSTELGHSQGSQEVVPFAKGSAEAHEVWATWLVGPGRATVPMWRSL